MKNVQADIGVQGGRIVNVREPIDKNDVATKKYVDNQIEGAESPPAVLQTEGQSETAVMSQKAVTLAIEKAINKAAQELVKKQNLFDMIYPVGSIYMSINSVNPSRIFGGEWVSWGEGRVPVGMGSNGTTNYMSLGSWIDKVT